MAASTSAAPIRRRRNNDTAPSLVTDRAFPVSNGNQNAALLPIGRRRYQACRSQTAGGLRFGWECVCVL